MFCMDRGAQVGQRMTDQPSVISRRGLLGAFAATALIAAPTYSNAAGFLRGAGDIRRLKMYSRRTGESLDVIYWIEGDYIKDALTEVNWFMRDWRRDRSRAIDTRTVDIIAATQQLLDTPTPFLMLSGYRTPETNALLRKRSRGVAKNSLHMKGQRWPELPPPALPAGLAAILAPTSSILIAAKSAFGAASFTRQFLAPLQCGNSTENGL